MKSESERYLKLLEQRLALLDSLVKTLAESRADFIAMDLDAIQGRIQEQEQFCTQIRTLDNDITSAQVRCAKLAGVPAHADEIFWPDSQGSPANVGEQIRATMRRVAASQKELKRLNDAHQAMLRRSRRTVNVLVNFFHSYSSNYAVPVSPKTGTMCEERV